MTAANLVLAAHLLCVCVMLACSLPLAFFLPGGLAASLEPRERAQVWTAVIDRVRGPAFGAVAGVFATGFMNLTNLSTRPGLLLLVKVVLALVVGGHVLAQLNGPGRRFADLAVGNQDSVAADVEAAERSMRRLGTIQLGLVALIVVLSLNL